MQHGGAPLNAASAEAAPRLSKALLVLLAAVWMFWKGL
jgi:hypothetical protein